MLHEGDSFLVTLDYDMTIPPDPLSISFKYEAWFDTTDRNSINDAFEAALIDVDGRPLVHTFTTDRDAYFNLTEEMPGPGQRGHRTNRRRLGPSVIGHFASCARHAGQAGLSSGK